MAGQGPGWPPTAPTAAEEHSYEGLTQDLQAVLREYRVNYSVWATLQASGFSGLADFAEDLDLV